MITIYDTVHEVSVMRGKYDIKYTITRRKSPIFSYCNCI